MPAQPQMVMRLSRPAMPFIQFQLPEIMRTPSTTPSTFIAPTWKSRRQASRMFSARMAAGNVSAHLLAASFGW